MRTLNYDEWEVIVASDGGEHSFDGLTQDLKASLPLTLTSIPKKGPAAARNHGARLAKGELLAFVDDDCIVTSEWLTSFAEGFEQLPADALGGQLLNPYADNLAATAWHFLVDFLYDDWRYDDGTVGMIVSSNAAYRRDVFLELGGFDESYGSAGAEDRELSIRLMAHGYRQYYYPSAQVWHYQNLRSPLDYIKRQFRYGRGASRLYRQLAEQDNRPFFLSKNRKRLYPARLWRALRQRDASVGLAGLIALSQLAHRAGRYYQNVLTTFSDVRERRLRT